MQPPIETVLDDLQRKILVVGGEAGWGKTVLVKTLTEMALSRGWVAQCYDISMAWFHDSPLPHRVTAYDWGSPSNHMNTLYDMATLKGADRRLLIGRLIEEEWTNRVNGVRNDPDYLDTVSQCLQVFEEGNTYFDSANLNKKDWCGDVLTNFVSVRRNLKYTGIVVATAVSGEIATKFRKRCNYLVGKLMSDEEKRYIRNSTSKELVNVAEELEPYKFVYQGSKRILEPFGVDYKRFRCPQELYAPPPPQLQTMPQPKPRSLWDNIKNALK